MVNHSRRTFGVRLLAGAGAVALAGTTTACPAWMSSNVFKNILTYVGVGLTAFQAVVALVAPGGVAIAGIIALVKAGFADLQLAVQDYNNAPAASKTTLLNKIKVVLGDLQSELQSFWSNLNLPGGTIATLVQGLLGIILSTLAGFSAALPGTAYVPSRTLPTNAIPVTPKKRSKGEFEAEFNKALTDAGQPAVKFS